ncbi:hypothetical protein CAEBREN_11190 [Caenorhabditis brenneri]|uniref:Uncharacterized protein n=1 Tax=Caenorhabditis brenneri TaxID=135651 RepID=G0NY48_CAEBE|nr:hypothetical protein CAEBREN_11190 [Caenorhabditis brenneri]
MENAIFMYKDGYILLEDLQSQFSSGLISADENVQIFRRGSRLGDCLRVDDVIEKYCESTQSKPPPDTMKPQSSPFLSNSLYTSSRAFKNRNVRIESSTSTAPEAQKPKEKSKVNSMLLLKLMNQKRLKGYPLFNLSQEPDGEMITGQNVLDELGKLETSLNENLNPNTRTEYFQAVEKIHGRVTCSSCNFEKKSIEDALFHLFSEEHKRKLSESSVSKNSFQFWIDHVEECKKLDKEEPRKISRRVSPPESEPEPEEEEPNREKKVFTEYENPHWRTNRYLFPGQVNPKKYSELRRDPHLDYGELRLPLLHSNTYDEPLELNDSDIDLLAELFSKLKPSYFHISGSWLGRYMHGKIQPRYCETCECFITKSYWKITKHVLSKKHLMSLESVSSKDYNWWLYAMRASVPKGRTNYTVTLNYIKRQYIRRHEAIRVRLSTAKLNRKKIIREVNYFCYHCPGKPKLSTMWEVIEHVFNDEHCVNIAYLAYPNDFVYYENLIDEYTLPTSKQKEQASKVYNIYYA